MYWKEENELGNANLFVSYQWFHNPVVGNLCKRHFDLWQWLLFDRLHFHWWLHSWWHCRLFLVHRCRIEILLPVDLILSIHFLAPNLRVRHKRRKGQEMKWDICELCMPFMCRFMTHKVEILFERQTKSWTDDAMNEETEQNGRWAAVAIELYLLVSCSIFITG